MVRVKEVIVVEGKYDKNTLSQIVDAVIVETGGFGIFSDREKLSLLRRLAEKRGLVVLMDSDGAGFVIRRFLKGAIDPEKVKHAYIPDVAGKEKRKSSPSKEGKLGVEGMEPAVLIEALRRAGATLDETSAAVSRAAITKADLYAAGLTGLPGSEGRRRAFQKKLGLPEKLSANALVDVLNALMDRESFLAEMLVQESAGQDGAQQQCRREPGILQSAPPDGQSVQRGRSQVDEDDKGTEHHGAGESKGTQKNIPSLGPHGEYVV